MKKNWYEYMFSRELVWKKKMVKKFRLSEIRNKNFFC